MSVQRTRLNTPSLLPRKASARTRWSAWLSAALAITVVASVGIADGITAAPAQAANPAVISLTFDDANADQLVAASIMKSNGLRGTFYIPSGYVDQPGYLTVADLKSLAADGNEIAGHTVTHPDLAALPNDEAVRQICNDRVNLSNWGLRVTSFAYPFASLTAANKTAVQNCGYNSARGLGDIQTRFGCSGCALVESIPPADPFNMRAPDQIDTSWTLTDLKNAVIQAETTGGWMQLTFHHIGASADPLSVTTSQFSQFAAWLKTRPSTTTVKTIDQVIGGTVKPLVSGPVVAPKPIGSNLITNPGLETLLTGVPQCWLNGGYGTNTPTFTTTAGRTGARAVQLRMAGYVSGDAKWLPALDLGGCSPNATPGRSYVIGAWYKSTAPTQFELYYRTGLGSWTYWTASPFFAGSANYVKATWLTPALPPGASAVSFGLNLMSNGTLATDDYEMFDAAGMPPPTPPAAGTNLVQNAGLETAGTGVTPQCWQTSTFGTNTSVYSTVATAHTGTKAGRLIMSGYSSGDAKLVQNLDGTSCAPAAIAGHSYSLRAWYTSTTVTQFALYYRNAAGTWVYWTSSPWFAATSSYTQASYTTPALPAGATAISFGLNLFGNGTLITDDYSMYDTVGAPPL